MSFPFGSSHWNQAGQSRWKLRSHSPRTAARTQLSVVRILETPALCTCSFFFEAFFCFFSPDSEARQEPPLRERAVDTAACQQEKIALAVSSCLALCSALLVSVHEGFAGHTSGSFCTSDLINIIVQCRVQTHFYIQTMYPQALSAASAATEEKGPDKKVLCVAFNCFSHVFPFRPCVESLLLDADLCQPQGGQARQRHSRVQQWCFCLSGIAFPPASNQTFAKSCRGRQTNLFADRGGFDFAICCSFSQEVLVRVTLCL